MIELGTLSFGADISGVTTVKNNSTVKRDYNNNVHILSKTGKDKIFTLNPTCPLCSQAFTTIMDYVKDNIGEIVVYKDNQDNDHNVKILGESLDYKIERNWVTFEIKLLELLSSSSSSSSS